MDAEGSGTVSAVRPHRFDWVVTFAGLLFGLAVNLVLPFMASERPFLSEEKPSERKSPVQSNRLVKALSGAPLSPECMKTRPAAPRLRLRHSWN